MRASQLQHLAISAAAHSRYHTFCICCPRPSSTPRSFSGKLELRQHNLISCQTSQRNNTYSDKMYSSVFQPPTAPAHDMARGTLPNLEGPRPVAQSAPQYPLPHSAPMQQQVQGSYDHYNTLATRPPPLDTIHAQDNLAPLASGTQPAMPSPPIKSLTYDGRRYE